MEEMSETWHLNDEAASAEKLDEIQNDAAGLILAYHEENEYLLNQKKHRDIYAKCTELICGTKYVEIVFPNIGKHTRKKLDKAYEVMEKIIDTPAPLPI